MLITYLDCSRFFVIVMAYCTQKVRDKQMRNLPKNEVATTTEMNLAAAKYAESFQKACLLFRMLEHANNRGTGEHQYDILEKHFNEKESIY